MDPTEYRLLRKIIAHGGLSLQDMCDKTTGQWALDPDIKAAAKSLADAGLIAPGGGYTLTATPSGYVAFFDSDLGDIDD